MGDELDDVEMRQLRRMDGIHYGALTDDELRLFRRAAHLGLCRRVFDGVAGFLGLSKVELYRKDAPDGE